MMVLVVVLLAVAVVSALTPHRLPGSPQAVPVPGPPALGDCVVSPVRYADSMPLEPAKDFAYPAKETSKCTGDRYAEVTAVIADPSKPRILRNVDSSYAIEDDNSEQCYSAALKYLGLPVGGISAASGFDAWSVNVPLSVQILAPSARQAAAHQHWVACSLGLPPAQDQSGEWQRYPGSIRNAMIAGTRRDVFGICQAGPDEQSEMLFCSEPHTIQEMAFGAVGKTAVSRSDVEQNCRRAISTVTGLTDITAHGALVMTFDIYGPQGAPISGVGVPAKSFVTCGLRTTGTRKLAGSLIALGTRPIPWA